MKILVAAILSLSFISAYANECRSAYGKAKGLEGTVKDWLYITETDDNWTAFASFKKTKSSSKEDIYEALQISTMEEYRQSDDPFFYMESASEAYSFLERRLSWAQETIAEGDEEEIAEAKRTETAILNLISILKSNYGDNVRLLYAGSGTESFSYFVGEIMITVIGEDGCVFGIMAMNVWT